MNTRARDERLFYQTHVFCCVNQRPAGHPRSCCADRGSKELHAYMKARAKELGIADIRVNQAGCLERCELGPALVIYPEGVWYGYETREDVDEILSRHVLGGEVVERLALLPDQRLPRPRLRVPFKVKVELVENLTPDVIRVDLIAADGASLPPFEAGAHIDVITGGGHHRSYSLANDPAERHRYVLGVLRERNGRGGSAWMHEHLEVGMTLEVFAPINNFPLVESAFEHLLIAGGIGITPLKAMAHRLASIGARYTLYCCTRTAQHTPFHKELRQFCGENVVFVHDSGEPSRGLDLKSLLAEPHEGRHVYVCGPPGLLAAARAATAHWASDRVHFERFVAAAAGTHSTDDQPFEIQLSRHARTLTVPAGQSILDTLRAAGIAMDSSCEEGLCGTCKLRLIAGTVDHRDEILTPEEKTRGDTIITCVSRAAAGSKLVLDI